MERIVIIDGNSLINRAYYAMQRPMITKEGIYTQGIYGFLNMLTKIEEDYEPTYLTVAFDLKAPTFRHLEYDGYKAGRKAMPPELAMEMPVLKDILHAMNIVTLELEGFEADDIIGTVSRVGEENGLYPLIVTGDKDALQLASDITNVLITKKGVTDFEIYDSQKMLERYEMTPLQFIDLKGIMGDSSDNIPGIPGIGEKGGIELLKQFGSIENMLAHTDEIKKAGMRNKVEENTQLALMSKRLATINRFVPIDFELDDFRLGEPDYKKLVELYTKLEFNSFLKKIDYKDYSTDLTESDFNPENIVLNKKTDDISKLKGKCFIKVFGDTKDYLRKSNAVIDGVFLMDDEYYYYSSLESFDADKFNTAGLKLFGHDIKDDIFCLMSKGVNQTEVYYDSAIAAYVIDPTRSKYDLNTICIEKMHYNVPDPKDFVGNVQIDMFTDSSAKFAEYGTLLCECVKKIIDIENKEIQDNDLEKVLYDVELPLIEVLASMELSGICLDLDYLNEFGIVLKEEIKRLESEIYAISGTEFNIKSPKQLGEVLFETLGLPSGKKTKTGYSTGAEVLEKLKDEHPVVPLILEYRNLTKLDSTYVEGLKPLISKDGKIHAHFQQTITQTGRLSCTEPNLQNIPVRQELGRKLRSAFHASEKHCLIGADYSQIELRILAHLSDDPALIEAFNSGQDIHKMTASRVLGIPLDEVTPPERSKAKAVNFGVIYGMSSFGLSEEIKVTRKEADEYINDYFFKHPLVKKYMDQQISLAKEKGYSETISGRKRSIPEIKANQFMVRQLGERLAMNTPIQGSAADIIKIAMIKVYNDLKENHPNSKLILQVHDELIIDADINEIEEIESLLVRDMEDAMSLNVKLEASLNTAENWYDLK